MIKNTRIYGSFGLLVVTVISGCSTSGMMRAQHNGKQYWNPGNCESFNYNYSDPDTLYCLTDGVRNGQVLRPASQQQIDNYYREQELSQNNSANSLSSYSGSSSNTVNCYSINDIRLNKEIKTFNGSICPMGYLQKF